MLNATGKAPLNDPLENFWGIHKFTNTGILTVEWQHQVLFFFFFAPANLKDRALLTQTDSRNQQPWKKRECVWWGIWFFWCKNYCWKTLVFYPGFPLSTQVFVSFTEKPGGLRWSSRGHMLNMYKTSLLWLLLFPCSQVPHLSWNHKTGFIQIFYYCHCFWHLTI